MAPSATTSFLTLALSPIHGEQLTLPPIHGELLALPPGRQPAGLVGAWRARGRRRGRHGGCEREPSHGRALLPRRGRRRRHRIQHDRRSRPRRRASSLLTGIDPQLLGLPAEWLAPAPPNANTHTRASIRTYSASLLSESRRGLAPTGSAGLALPPRCPRDRITPRPAGPHARARALIRLRGHPPSPPRSRAIPQPKRARVPPAAVRRI